MLKEVKKISKKFSFALDTCAFGSIFLRSRVVDSDM